MALTESRRLHYRDWIHRIEHHTSKKVLSWEQCYNRFGFDIYFTDETALYLAEGEALPDNPEELEYKPLPGSICVSCGEKRHGASVWNWKGQCSLTVKTFWEKARKVFWHRHLQARKTKLNP